MAPADGNAFSVEAFAPRRRVDHRLSLRIYFRTADNILKQASVYRREANTLELYVLLLRYASLVSETIPDHRQYLGSNPLDKLHLKRKLVEALQELETLKPDVQSLVRARNQLATRQAILRQEKQQPVLSSQDNNGNVYKASLFENKLSWRLPTPSAETIARHSFLVSKPHISKPLEPFKIQYPCLFDPAPPETNSVTPPTQPQAPEAVLDQKDEDVVTLLQPVEPPSQFDLVNQLSPPPVSVPVEMPQESCSPVSTEPDLSLEIDALPSKEPKHLHMSSSLMDEFMRMAKSNTSKNIETCGVLAGSLEGGNFFVTALIIPKQQATANTCETIDEEEIFFAQDKRGLFQLGWIHTHPTQSCFMSSVDVHTHYSYQVMLPEAIAIVMAPQDASKNFGIFRLSDPGGMNVIQQCSKRGFHGHDPTSDGTPLYHRTSHVYLDPKVKFDVVDLR
ncbi:AMSH-like ubiquitin thioesterase 1 isoform X1 [Selaginella moellendorffii]|nr:AMSH-like ubiquitin thioesterase 1 isoform X1 [Selaginella moellendorffii]|eukprot:XP_024517990.1 AMSH-like ubiquitin thioesterase 1 isoform X1 [Selaginella moellendorffii]